MRAYRKRWNNSITFNLAVGRQALVISGEVGWYIWRNGDASTLATQMPQSITVTASGEAVTLTSTNQMDWSVLVIWHSVSQILPPKGTLPASTDLDSVLAPGVYVVQGDTPHGAGTGWACVLVFCPHENLSSNVTQVWIDGVNFKARWQAGYPVAWSQWT